MKQIHLLEFSLFLIFCTGKKYHFMFKKFAFASGHYCLLTNANM